MIPFVTLIEQGALRLNTISEREAALYHGPDLLLFVDLIPAWRCSSPYRAALLALGALRSHPPRFEPDAAPADRQPGGAYWAGSDTIFLFHRRTLAEDHAAEILVHEIAHAAGGPARLRHSTYVPSDAALDIKEVLALPSVPFSAECADMQHEEVCASFTSAILLPRLGVLPRFEGHWSHWFPRAVSVAPERLPGIIAAARDRSDFILGSGDFKLIPTFATENGASVNVGDGL